MATRVLFICKKRLTEYGISYGLINSCRFLCNALERLGVEAKVVSVLDNNGIDREVHQYKPTHVFIEALWVVPEKFKVLLPRYRKVQWYVRLHSNIPFLANEGIAMEWLDRYAELQKHHKNFHIAANAFRLVKDLGRSRHMKIVYTPNVYYPDVYPHSKRLKHNVHHHHDVLNVGCFGAIRPMKNHLTQAIAAMIFANRLGKKLHFHINGRCEQKGDQFLRNLRYLFAGTKHKLVLHQWMPHHQFVTLVEEMDLGMQVSFSETFNIVAADFVAANVPLVGSAEIEWLNMWYKTVPTDTEDIVMCLYLAYYGKKVGLQKLNKIGLALYNSKALSVWVDLLLPNIF